LLVVVIATRAQIALKKAYHEFKAALSRRETAYNKEIFVAEYGSFWSCSATVSSKL